MNMTPQQMAMALDPQAAQLAQPMPLTQPVGVPPPGVPQMPVQLPGPNGQPMPQMPR